MILKLRLNEAVSMKCDEDCGGLGGTFLVRFADAVSMLALDRSGMLNERRKKGVFKDDSCYRVPGEYRILIKA